MIINGIEQDNDAPGAAQHLPVKEVLEALRLLSEYAYEQGFHEMGYDPVQEIEQIVLDAQKIGAFQFVGAKRPDPYKCEVRDCGSNVDGWCQWHTEHGTIPSRCDGNDPVQHVGLFNDLRKLCQPCDAPKDYCSNNACCDPEVCDKRGLCEILKRYKEPDLAVRLEWLDAEDDALREGLAHEGPRLVHELQDMNGFGSTSLRELSKSVGYSATMLSRCMTGKERFTAKLFLALCALKQKRTGILRLTTRSIDLVPKNETLANKDDGKGANV